MPPFWQRRRSHVDKNDEVRALADAVVQKQRVLTLSREMAAHAALLRTKALELKEMLEHGTAR